MAFSSKIGEVNRLEIKDTTIPPIKMVNPPIRYKKLLEMLTLSLIEAKGILIYNW